jgi:hypothetical protein
VNAGTPASFFWPVFWSCGTVRYVVAVPVDVVARPRLAYPDAVADGAERAWVPEVASMLCIFAPRPFATVFALTNFSEPSLFPFDRPPVCVFRPSRMARTISPLKIIPRSFMIPPIAAAKPPNT